MASRHNSGKKGVILSKIEAKMQDDDSSLQDSWVDLAEPPSRGSTSSVTMYTDPGLLIDAQRSVVASRHSPKSLQSPNVEFDTTLEAVKYKLARDILPLAEIRIGFGTGAVGRKCNHRRNFVFDIREAVA